jgi:hypothetical protein
MLLRLRKRAASWGVFRFREQTPCDHQAAKKQLGMQFPSRSRRSIACELGSVLLRIRRQGTREPPIPVAASKDAQETKRIAGRGERTAPLVSLRNGGSEIALGVFGAPLASGCKRSYGLCRKSFVDWGFGGAIGSPECVLSRHGSVSVREGARKKLAENLSIGDLTTSRGT